MNIHLSTSQNKMRAKMFRQMNLSWSDMSFSDRLKERMALLNIKAIEIATKLNLSRGTVSQWVIMDGTMYVHPAIGVVKYTQKITVSGNQIYNVSYDITRTNLTY